VLFIFINYCANLKIIFSSCVGVKNILSSEKKKKKKKTSPLKLTSMECMSMHNTNFALMAGQLGQNFPKTAWPRTKLMDLRHQSRPMMTNVSES
jgi:hypothetical protein